MTVRRVGWEVSVEIHTCTHEWEVSLQTHISIPRERNKKTRDRSGGKQAGKQTDQTGKGAKIEPGREMRTQTLGSMAQVAH